GEIIGFDGSLSKGPKEIFSHLQPIFESHPTPPFVTKVKSVRSLGEGSVILRAIAGMRHLGESDINPELNTHHTLIAGRKKDGWNIELFQNTPPQFHGLPELVEQMTEELRAIL
ncbi:SgcJ/EcaC family oxidoreductase, partial [Halobacillus sp. BBL2006]|uniref:SgcJ/EcaC family oxidoreductase n=1 Tax=Halobacillus sp. BBL2006 TaxID=1543706 RepID=UPI0005425815